MREVRGKLIRARGGRFRPSKQTTPVERDDRPSALRRALPLRPAAAASTFPLIEGGAIFRDYTEVDEDDDYIVPRKSLTQQQHLRLFPQEIEFERLKDNRHFQPAPKSLKVPETTTTVQVRTPFVSKDNPGKVESVTLKGRLIETTDPRYRVTFKSAKNLLDRRHPDSLEAIKFTRITSHSKRAQVQFERPATLTIEEPPDLGPRFNDD